MMIIEVVIVMWVVRIDLKMVMGVVMMLVMRIFLLVCISARDHD